MFSLIVISVAVILSIFTGELKFAICGVALLSLLLLSEVINESTLLNAVNHTPTPLNELSKRYVKISDKLDELKFIGTNAEEIANLKISVEEYADAIYLLKFKPTIGENVE